MIEEEAVGCTCRCTCGRSPAGFADLTAAQRRVAMLAAFGYTNRQIGSTLFLATSTVEQHLTNVYRRLGIKGRAEILGTIRQFNQVTPIGRLGAVPQPAVA
ncbi:helix-turn-helix domain-containing protein [Kibdelosporangium phytohabitans]|nr:helix-turn-helix transcriptional regulator [Kibdelosporangium phytohabitans]MBE1463250.1 DNA-binding CsgD family transcriptional regulator [Kibdelosporangium phytohabitans]